MREISSLTLVLSDKCNFSCPYCPQRKGKNKLTIEDIRDFLDLLRPRLAREVWLGFYGGEPLLSWPLVKKTVAFAEKNFKNKFRFTLTTNGSLLKKEHILFFKKHRFDLLLSYDGLVQKNRDARSLPAVEAALTRPAAALSRWLCDQQRLHPENRAAAGREHGENAEAGTLTPAVRPGHDRSLGRKRPGGAGEATRPAVGELQEIPAKNRQNAPGKFQGKR